MPKTRPIQSIMRALDVLELAGLGGDGIRLLYMARSLTLNKPTVHNIVKTLVHRGYLARVPSPIRYRLGPALADLRRFQRERDLMLRALPKMIEIAQKARAEVFLAKHMADEPICFLHVFPPGSGETVNTGPWRLVSYGIALLFQAYMSAEEKRDFRRRHPFSEADRTLWKSPRHVDRFITKVRRQGYLLITGVTFRAAAPIFGQNNSLRAIIGMSKPGGGISLKERTQCLDMIRRAAEELSGAGPATPATIVSAERDRARSSPS